MHTAHALVRTDRPDRYAAQLAKHLGHRIETAWENGAGFVKLAEGSGRCKMSSTEDGLRLEASGETPEDLARIEDVVKRHLERWGDKEQIAINWSAGSA